MRTKHEVSEALRHIGEALAGCPPKDHGTFQFAASCKMYEVLAWVLKQEEGERFAALIAHCEAIDDAEKVIQ